MRISGLALFVALFGCSDGDLAERIGVDDGPLLEPGMRVAGGSYVDLWVGGNDELLQHWDGSDWRQIEVLARDLVTTDEHRAAALVSEGGLAVLHSDGSATPIELAQHLPGDTLLASTNHRALWATGVDGQTVLRCTIDSCTEDAVLHGAIHAMATPHAGAWAMVALEPLSAESPGKVAHADGFNGGHGSWYGSEWSELGWIEREVPFPTDRVPHMAGTEPDAVVPVAPVPGQAMTDGTYAWGDGGPSWSSGSAAEVTWTLVDWPAPDVGGELHLVGLVAPNFEILAVYLHTQGSSRRVLVQPLGPDGPGEPRLFARHPTGCDAPASEVVWGAYPLGNGELAVPVACGTPLVHVGLP